MVDKVVKQVRVKNALGLHTRPATLIVRALQGFSSSVKLTYKKECVDAKSILNLLMLAAPKNALLTITAEGEDAAAAVTELVSVFEGGFGE